jgi:hypothetical protein
VSESGSRRRVSARVFEFCSGLVDLVVCVRHHLGGGHRLALAGERFVGRVVEHIAQVGDRGRDFGDRRRRERTEREPGDGGRRFVASEPVEKRRDDGEGAARPGGVAPVVVVADRQRDIVERGQRVAVFGLDEVYLARERARRGDRDEAVALMRAATDQLFREGQLLAWGIPATGVLVETLLDRGAESDVVEAEAAIERLAAAPADEGLVIREIWLLRMRALLAQTLGDETAYGDDRDRYRDMATSLGFEGHMKWAEAMP